QTILDLISFRSYYLGHGNIQRSSGWFSIYFVIFFHISIVTPYIISFICRDGGTSLKIFFISYYIISLGLARLFDQWILACAAYCGLASVGGIR
ncbi:hypothetical protein HOY80DRAFT_943350, partial [Tuber brumale]